jgi:glutamate--cysteine ligase
MFQINTKTELESFISENWNQINDYLDKNQDPLTTPFYSSVDIRESKNKFAPVDCNIYPAGFNNMCNMDLDSSVLIFSKVISRMAKGARNIAIIPEEHTKNLFYLDHLAILGKTILEAGYNVSFLSFAEDAPSEQNLTSHSGYEIVLEKADIKDGILFAGDDKIDLAILNNDQSKILGVDWKSIKTPVSPTPHIGWFRRQKNEHFEFYQEVVNKFCDQFSINPNLLQANFKTIENIDFSSKEGIENLAKNVDELIEEIDDESPHVFIKASQGTYGMGISVVKSGEEVMSMNRKSRNKMDIGKNKIKFTSVLAQEGIETIIKYDNMPAEVTIYLVDGKSVGGFMRANSEKSSQGNLNSRGMVFRKFCISEIRQNQEHKCKEAIYSVVARLSTMAAGAEIRKVLNEENLI